MPNPSAEQLSSIIEQWAPRLRQLSEEQIRFRPSPDRWSIAEVVGHLVDSACNNHQRFVRAQFVSELTFPKYEQNEWTAAAGYHSMDWQTLVNLWASYNAALAHLIQRIPESSLTTMCTITPFDPTDLKFLVTDYVVHQQHHLDRIDERLQPE